MIKLPRSLTTVTLFSKTLAGIIFIALILTAFFVGTKYQAMTDLIKIKQSNPVITKLSPTPTDNATSWQTYRNEEYGFEVKYPGEWESPTHFLGNTQMLDVDVIKIPKNNFLSAAITNIEIQIVADQHACRRGESSEDTYQIEKNMSINKIPFQVATWAYTPPQFGYEYSTQKNNLCYKITLIFEGENTNEFWGTVYANRAKNSLFGIMDQILSTFKFTDQTDPTSNWKTYKGAYPINFSYPQNLKLSEGDADYFSVIVLTDPLEEDREQEFEFKMPYATSSTELIQALQRKGFTKEKELHIDGFLATQFQGTGTPNAFIALRKTTEVIVQVNKQAYEIINWGAGDNNETFQKILSSIKFKKG